MGWRDRERDGRDTYVLIVHFSQGVITIPPRQALWRDFLVVVVEGLVVEEEEVEEVVDEDGVKPMRWWVMVLLLLLLLLFFGLLPFFLLSCIDLVLVLVQERQVVDRKKK